MSYRIITDTCCDFPEAVYEELGLGVVRLNVNFRGESVNTYTEEWLKDMFNGLRAGESATTAAANPAEWEAVIEPVLAAGEDALVLVFSSGLSTTYQSAVIAAEELMEKYPDRKINVVDTLCVPKAGRGSFSGGAHRLVRGEKVQPLPLVHRGRSDVPEAGWQSQRSYRTGWHYAADQAHPPRG